MALIGGLLKLGYKCIGGKKGVKVYKKVTNIFFGNSKDAGKVAQKAISTGRPNEIRTDIVKVYPDGRVRNIRRYALNREGQHVSWSFGNGEPKLQAGPRYSNGNVFGCKPN